MLNLKDKKVVLKEIKKLEKELENAKGFFTILAIQDDLIYLKEKLKQLI